MTSPKRWIVQMLDAPDGSGDGIVQLPDELWKELEAQGWEVGDVLDYDLVSEPGSVVIRNHYAECRRP